MVENVLTYAVASGKGAFVVIVTIIVDWFDSGPQRYEHFNSPPYDVYTSRHLNIHWGLKSFCFSLFN